MLRIGLDLYLHKVRARTLGISIHVMDERSLEKNCRREADGATLFILPYDHYPFFVMAPFPRSLGVGSYWLRVSYFVASNELFL